MKHLLLNNNFGTADLILSFTFFLEYLESKVLHEFKCSPVEYLAIFECTASLQVRPRDSLKKWATCTSDGKCKIEVPKVAWVHVKISWEKVA